MRKPRSRSKFVKVPAIPVDQPLRERTTESTEDRMIKLIDEYTLFKALQPDLQKALATKDVKTMLKGSSAWAVAKLISLVENASSDAAKVAALKDLLDRAGYKPVEKQMTMDVTAMTDAELEARLKSAMKEAYGDEWQSKVQQITGKKADSDE